MGEEVVNLFGRVIQDGSCEKLEVFYSVGVTLEAIVTGREDWMIGDPKRTSRTILNVGYGSNDWSKRSSAYYGTEVFFPFFSISFISLSSTSLHKVFLSSIAARKGARHSYMEVKTDMWKLFYETLKRVLPNPSEVSVFWLILSGVLPWPQNLWWI